jgi:hypothetical protein
MIRTLQLYGISLPPREIAAELECLQAWENIVVQPPAKTGRVVTANIKAFSGLVPGTAFTLNA